MILFVNVFLSDGGSPMGVCNDRYLLPNHSQQEIFLYTLHSYSTIQWSKVIIYCEVDSAQKSSEEELFSKIRAIFPESSLYNKRSQYQPDWQKALEEIFAEEDDLIWYAGNHDHPYIAPNHIQLNRIVDAISQCDDIYKGGCYSHFYENCVRFMPDAANNGWKHESECVSSYITDRTDAMLIVNKAILKNWWFDHHYGDKKIPRTDWPSGGVISPQFKCFQPTKELCRHFDGYNLLHCTFDGTDIPPISVPEGFWTKQIKIAYLTPQRIPGFTWINPMISNYRAQDINGADMKRTLDDLPMFWSDRISEVKSMDCNIDNVIEARNLARYREAVPRSYSQAKMMADPQWRERKDYRFPVPEWYLKELYS